MPPTPEPADKLYQRMMKMQHQAFMAPRSDAAYQLMAAALRAATTAEAVRGRIAAEAALRRTCGRHTRAD